MEVVLCSPSHLRPGQRFEVMPSQLGHKYITHCNNKPIPASSVKGQSLGFTSQSVARVLLAQALSIATCGILTHKEMTACDWMPNMLQ